MRNEIYGWGQICNLDFLLRKLAWNNGSLGVSTANPRRMSQAVMQGHYGERATGAALTAYTQQDIEHRRRWVNDINRLSHDFATGAEQLQRNLVKELEGASMATLLAYIRLCGVVPEGFGLGGAAERLYLKYADVVIHQAFTAMGFTSAVLNWPLVAPSVECVCDDYSFIADALAFRMSRVAKNRKDIDVMVVGNRKHGRPFAMLVGPSYQLPYRASQIYRQAATHSVLVCTYTHLATLVQYAHTVGHAEARALLHRAFKTVGAMAPSSDASLYWATLNGLFLGNAGAMAPIWREELAAVPETIRIAKDEALGYLAVERRGIMALPHEEAVHQILDWRKVGNRTLAVESVTDTVLSYGAEEP